MPAKSKAAKISFDGQVTLPTEAYAPEPPTADQLQAILPWVLDRTVRHGRDSRYCAAYEVAFAEVFAITRPENGFIDSDGLSCDGRDAQGFDAQGRDRNGRDRDGYDRDGYDADGFNRKGKHFYGHDRTTMVKNALSKMGPAQRAEYAAQLTALLADSDAAAPAKRTSRTK
jgi:hypothetical protein